jgi:DNA-binding LacI/PurR family transcriptional regulator
MRAFLARGMRIPQDVKLVGIDDVPYASMLPVPLTTVRQPCREIGQAALRAMLDRIRHPQMPSREILLGGELIVRASSGSPAARHESHSSVQTVEAS